MGIETLVCGLTLPAWNFWGTSDESMATYPPDSVPLGWNGRDSERIILTLRCSSGTFSDSALIWTLVSA